VFACKAWRKPYRKKPKASRKSSRKNSKASSLVFAAIANLSRALCLPAKHGESPTERNPKHPDLCLPRLQTCHVPCVCLQSMEKAIKDSLKGVRSLICKNVLFLWFIVGPNFYVVLLPGKILAYASRPSSPHRPAEDDLFHSYDCKAKNIARFNYLLIGLARTVHTYVYIQCIYGVFSKEAIIHKVVYGVCIQLRPSLFLIHAGGDDATCVLFLMWQSIVGCDMM
jgi:hypothetical protein